MCECATLRSTNAVGCIRWRQWLMANQYQPHTHAAQEKTYSIELPFYYCQWLRTIWKIQSWVEIRFSSFLLNRIYVRISNADSKIYDFWSSRNSWFIREGKKKTPSKHNKNSNTNSIWHHLEEGGWSNLTIASAITITPTHSHIQLESEY